MLKQINLLWRTSLFDRIHFWPCLMCLVLIIVFLQVFYIMLLSRLEEKETKIKENTYIVGRHLQGRMFNNVITEMEEIITNSNRFDRSGNYYILDNFLTSEHVAIGNSEYDVSVVSYSSSNHLYNLVELSERWNGPVSVSVFTFDDDFINTISSLVHFHFCNNYIYRHVSFHLVYPINRAPKHIGHLSTLKLNCLEHKLQIQNNDHLNSELWSYTNKDLEIPNNLLRNLAINYAQTPYVFAIDVDFLPSENLRLDFQKFMAVNSHLISKMNDGDNQSSLNSQHFLSAFVVPAFEIQDSIIVPRNKAGLIELWRNGNVRPFYWELCQQCQRPTNYDVWRVLRKADLIHIGYTVERQTLWEPFYIAKTSLPLYDERFKQYGYDRISQVCEMYVAGFTFHVLDNAFIVHKGFKVNDSFHANKEAENARNKQLFMKFKEELKTKYPQTNREC